MKLIPVILATAAVLLAGCSARAVYDNVQLNNQQDCARVPLSEYDACMAAASKTYDEYQREREELLAD